jgi:uncharacterized protein YhhL (DUF1145 family)
MSLDQTRLTVGRFIAVYVVNFKELQPCYTLIFVSEILCVVVLRHAYQIILQNQLKKIAASWNSDNLQSLRVLPF